VIAALIARVNANGRPGVDESKFVFSDQAYLRLTVSDWSPDALEQLRQAGLVITSQQGGALQGHIPIGSVQALAKLAFITRISPR
jgi:hypothetical protein